MHITTMMAPTFAVTPELVQEYFSSLHHDQEDTPLPTGDEDKSQGSEYEEEEPVAPVSVCIFAYKIYCFNLMKFFRKQPEKAVVAHHGKIHQNFNYSQVHIFVVVLLQKNLKRSLRRKGRINKFINLVFIVCHKHYTPHTNQGMFTFLVLLLFPSY